MQLESKIIEDGDITCKYDIPYDVEHSCKMEQAVIVMGHIKNRLNTLC